ncbi:MAG: IS4 family transposase [Candidatus Omnitrophica bacterium]|nr:IS4 family transposase [Candidatus Omnitrophota bacterium]
MQRYGGKITGSIFLDLIVFNSDNLKKQSLNDMSIELLNNHKIHITKQSIHERFNTYALLFLKVVLEKILSQQFIDQDKTMGFPNVNRILIKDSTEFQIDESLSNAYPGSGGGGSKAAVRIQYEYDILNGKINDLSINAFNDQDSRNSIDTIDIVKQGDLIIRDLAYMNLSVLSKISDQKAFYLSRINSSTKIYELVKGAYCELDFVKLTEEMKIKKAAMLERQVYIGSREKLPTRLIIHLMPEDEVAKRLRRAKENNKKKGRGNLGKDFKARAGLNLFISNTKAEDIPIEKVWPMYTLRRQIELMFKIWKSLVNIDKIKKVKQKRLEIYLFAKLILIVLSWKIIWRVSSWVYILDNKALSFYKSYKTMMKRIDELRNIFIKDTEKITIFIIKFYEVSKDYHLLEKRKHKLRSVEVLLYCGAKPERRPMDKIIYVE